MAEPLVLPFERVWGSEALTVTVVKREEFRASMRVVGELDLCGAPILQAALAAQLRARRRFLRLDLSELSFIDSCGIRVLQQMHAEALAERGTLIVVGATARTRRVLNLVGLDRELFLVDGFVEGDLSVPVG
jgi:anti-anti-sigma factor